PIHNRVDMFNASTRTIVQLNHDCFGLNFTHTWSLLTLRARFRFPTTNTWRHAALSAWFVKTNTRLATANFANSIWASTWMKTTYYTNFRFTRARRVSANLTIILRW